jgi:conjugative transfer pilus assembly protein TraH
MDTNRDKRNKTSKPGEPSKHIYATIAKYMFVIYMFAIGLMVLFQSSTASAAGMKNELGKVFSSMGFDNNVTAGGSYKDQMGGYYSGGSLFARSPVRSAQLMSVQAPSFKAGCGGIDMFAGGF